MNTKDIARRLIIAPIETDYSEDDVRETIEKGKAHDVRGVIVTQYFVDFARSLIPGNAPRLGMTVSYPLGAMTTEVKVKMTEYAVEKGLAEIDLSLDYNALKSGDYRLLQQDVEAVVKAAAGKLDVIAIPLVAKITLEELEKTCEVLLESGVNRVKTNSGMGLGETQLEHVLFIKRKFGDSLHIEVSGGVRNREQAEAFVEAGAECIHSSTWEKILGIN